MFDARIPYAGASMEQLQEKFRVVKRLISQVSSMKKPSNFTYIDCYDLSNELETLKRCIEAAIERKRNEKEGYGQTHSNDC